MTEQAIAEATHTITAPADGIYPDMPAVDYRATRALNASSLRYALQSLYHFKYHYEAPPSPPTPAMRLGTMVHTAILEPDEFEWRYAPGPINPKTGEPFGTNTNAFRDAEAEAGDGVTLVGKGELERLAAIRLAAWDHSESRAALHELTHTEASIFWTESDWKCKGRPDGVREGADGYILDVKTISRLNQRNMRNRLWDHGYDISAAWYQMGWKTLTGDMLPVYLLFAETVAPYDVALLAIDQDTLAVGAQRALTLFGAVREAKEKNQWPGIEASFPGREIGAPSWAIESAQSGMIPAEEINEDQNPF